MKNDIELQGRYMIETIHRKLKPTIYRALFVVEKKKKFLFWSWVKLKVFFIGDAGNLYEDDRFGVWHFDSYQKAALAIEKRNQIVKDALKYQNEGTTLSRYEPHLK